MQKNFWVLIWSKGAKIGPETRFFAIFSSLLHQFSLKVHTVVACDNVYHEVEMKSVKNFLSPNLVEGGQNQSRNQVFCYFFKFGSVIFLEIAYSDTLQQSVAFSRGKICKKNLGPNLVQGGQSRSQNQVFCYFLKFASLVFLEIAYSDRLQQCVTYSRGKMYEKNFGP